MCFYHALIQLRTHWAFCSHVPCTLTEPRNQVNRVFLDIVDVGQIVHQHNLIDSLAGWMLAIFNMHFHLLKDFIAFPFEYFPILILFLDSLLPPNFIFDFLQSINMKILELLLNLKCLIIIPLFCLLQSVRVGGSLSLHAVNSIISEAHYK